MLEFQFEIDIDDNERPKKSYTIIDCDQGTDEWLAARIGKITASNMNIFFGDGITKDKLVSSKVAEILTGKIDNRIRFSSKDTDAGNDLEDDARIAYEEFTGNKVDQIGLASLDEFVSCSPDGLIGENVGLEIKCPNDANFINAVIGGKAYIIPLYLMQMQMQMWVLELDWVDYVLYNPNFKNPIHIIRIDRNEKLIKEIKNQVELVKKEITNKIIKFNKIMER